MTMAKRISREISSRSTREFLLLQYELHFAARDQMRAAGRIVFTAFIAVSTFIPLSWFGGSLTESRILFRLTLLSYAALLFGASWFLEDRRRGRILRDIEEVLLRDASLTEDGDGDAYIRHRYYEYSMFYSQLWRLEPAIWLALALVAISFQLVSSLHSA